MSGGIDESGEPKEIPSDFKLAVEGIIEVSKLDPNKVYDVLSFQNRMGMLAWDINTVIKHVSNGKSVEAFHNEGTNFFRHTFNIDGINFLTIVSNSKVVNIIHSNAEITKNNSIIFPILTEHQDVEPESFVKLTSNYKDNKSEIVANYPCKENSREILERFC